MSESFLNGRVVLHAGDSRDVLKIIPDNSIDSIVTDPPYALVSIGKRFGSENARLPNNGGPTANVYNRTAKGFMGKDWDTGETAFAVEFWEQCLRVLKPGGHVVAFSGTRTYHRMACAIEDAGFEIRDQLQWVYGSGFPKSHDVSKGIDRAAGAERDVVGSKIGQPGYSLKQNDTAHHDRKAYGKYADAESECAITAPATASAMQWQGWGTALKPACEPICFGRKPLSEKTVAQNVLAHGVGAINIDGCRVGTDDVVQSGAGRTGFGTERDDNYQIGTGRIYGNTSGRWPANLLHDGSDEVLAGFPESNSSDVPRNRSPRTDKTQWRNGGADYNETTEYGDEGSAARFFYTAKADALDRAGSKHPTVKPVDLMQWLCRLVTPPGGTILDCFAGTGTTGEAAFREGFNAVLIEREAEYQQDIRRRMGLVLSGTDERARESIKARLKDAVPDHGPLFGGLDPIAEAAE